MDGRLAAIEVADEFPDPALVVEKLTAVVALVSDLVAIARDRSAIVPAPILVEPKAITGLSEPSLAEAV